MSDQLRVKVTASIQDGINKIKAMTAGLSGMGKQVNGTYNSWYAKQQKINNSFTNLNKNLNSSNKGLASMTKGMNRLLGVSKMYLIGDTLAKSIQSSLDMIETQNLFNVALGESAEATGQFVEQMSNLYGLDPTNLRNSIATFNMLAKSMGISGDNATTLSTNTAKLALDLASLTNVPINQVMADLRSGLVGQTETVYKYGIDLTEASLKQEALAQGITKSVRNMSQGEKMALRYSAMIRQTGMAQGDFARTINTPANQLKILGERMVNLGRSIGSIFVPALTQILPYLNAFLSILIDIANTIAKIFGYQAPTDKNNNQFKGIKDGAEDATGAINDMAKATKNATLPLDELNVLQKDSGSGGAGAGGASVLPDMKLTGFDNMMNSIKNTTDELKTKMKPVLDEIFKIIGDIGLAFLAWKAVGILLELGKIAKALYEIMAINLGVAILPSAEALALQTRLANLWKAFAPLLGIFATIEGVKLLFDGLKGILSESEFSWKNLGKAIAGVALVAGGLFLVFNFNPVVLGITAVVGALTILGTYIYKNREAVLSTIKDAWGKIVEVFGNVADWFNENVIIPTTTFFSELWDNILEMVAGLDRGMKVIMAVLPSWFNKTVIQPIRTFFSNMWTAIQTMAQNTWDFIVRVWTVVSNWFNTNIITPLTTTFTTLWNLIKTLAQTTWGAIVTTWTVVKKWFEDNVTKPVYTLFNTVWTNIGNFASTAWGNIKDTWIKAKTWFETNVTNPIKGVFKTMGNGIIGVFNSVIAGIQVVIDGAVKAVNKLSSIIDKMMNGLEDALDFIGVDVDINIPSFTGITLPKIPLLANGGMLAGGDLFVAGEGGMAEMIGSYNGKTTVMPLENTDFVDAIYRAVSNAMSSLDLSGQVIENVVNLDGEKIYANQKKVERRKGFKFGMGVFSR